MKKTILASLAVAAMLASCSKESEMDVSITSTQTPIEFTAYAGSATTKGTPINSNTDFQDATKCGTFEVSSYLDVDGDTSTSPAPQKYFGFSTVNYSSNKWTNTDNIYWPNYGATLYFGATSPAITGANYVVTTGSPNTHALTFAYTVSPTTASGENSTGTIAAQKDVMYAITSESYTAPEDGDPDTVDDATTVNLHFKHALTQIAFTATKDDALAVTVNSIQLCNIMTKSTFTATKITDDANVAKEDSGSGSGSGNTDNATTEDGYVDMSTVGSWITATEIGHYNAIMVGYNAVTVGDSATQLTNTSNVLMLIPQKLTAWDPTSTSVTSTPDNSSYLAIDCVIKHTEGEAVIYDGMLFVPFDTTGIDYADNEGTDNTWAPGYKITYNLDFGGGYYDPTDDTTIPDPGETPDPDEVLPTLRAITFTTTVDAWESISATEIDLGDSDDLNVL